MKRIKFITLSLVPFLVIGCSGANKDDHQEVEVKVANQFGDTLGEGEYNEKFNYSDSWFLEDNTSLNYELALASAITGGASYSNSLDNNGAKIAQLLINTGYSNIEKNYYYQNGVKLEDSLGVIIGQKQIKDKSGKEYTLLAIFPRDSGYGAEWAGNFNITEEGVHEGFLLARDEMLRFTKHYIDSKEVKGALKIWTAGYSRGAATSNMYGAFLADGGAYLGNNVTLNPTDLYVYTIGTPNNVTSSIAKSTFLSVTGPRENYNDTNVPAYLFTGEGNINPVDTKYDFIHNFTAYGDYVSKIAPTAWGFTRFGKTEMVTYGSEAMRNYLTTIDTKVAESFEDKDFVTSIPMSKVDYNTVSIVDDESNKMSIDALINSRFTALTALAPNAASYVNDGYKDALGSLITAFAIDNGLVDAFKETSTLTLVKAVAATYLSYNGEKLGLEDNVMVANTIMDIMDLLGKTIDDRNAYTDQDLLQDVFDLLINDYRTSDVAKVRTIKISQLLGEPYGDLFLSLAEYAKEKGITVNYFDDFVVLLGNYYCDHKEDPAVLELVNTLADKLPEEYIPQIGTLTGKTYDDEHYPTVHDKAVAGVKDILECCVKGRPDDDIKPYAFRSTCMFIIGFLLYQYPGTTALLLNGAVNSEEGDRAHYDANKLEVTVTELLKLSMPTKEGSTESMNLKEFADDTLTKLFEEGRTTVNSKYIDLIIDNLDVVKNILMAFVFNPGTTHNLSAEINNAVTIYNYIDFIIPAHFFELYVCYLRTKI